jgi:hypothetical protein
MTLRTATLLRIFALGALGAGLTACKAVDLAPRTDAARAANEAASGYPRLADVPPEPVDAACVRAGLSDSLIAVAAPAPVPASPFTAEDADPFEGQGVEPGVTYRAAVAPGPAGTGPYSSVWSSLRSLADTALGPEADAGDADGPAGFVDCPPGPGVEAARLAAAREELERAAAQMRAQRPVAPGVSIDLPADLPARAAPETPQ